MACSDREVVIVDDDANLHIDLLSEDAFAMIDITDVSDEDGVPTQPLQHSVARLGPLANRSLIDGVFVPTSSPPSPQLPSPRSPVESTERTLEELDPQRTFNETKKEALKAVTEQPGLSVINIFRRVGKNLKGISFMATWHALTLLLKSSHISLTPSGLFVPNPPPPPESASPAPPPLDHSILKIEAMADIVRSVVAARPGLTFASVAKEVEELFPSLRAESWLGYVMSVVDDVERGGGMWVSGRGPYARVYPPSAPPFSQKYIEEIVVYALGEGGLCVRAVSLLLRKFNPRFVSLHSTLDVLRQLAKNKRVYSIVNEKAVEYFLAAGGSNRCFESDAVNLKAEDHKIFKLESFPPLAALEEVNRARAEGGGGGELPARYFGGGGMFLCEEGEGRQRRRRRRRRSAGVESKRSEAKRMGLSLTDIKVEFSLNIPEESPPPPPDMAEVRRAVEDILAVKDLTRGRLLARLRRADIAEPLASATISNLKNEGVLVEFIADSAVSKFSLASRCAPAVAPPPPERKRRRVWEDDYDVESPPFALTAALHTTPSRVLQRGGLFSPRRFRVDVTWFRSETTEGLCACAALAQLLGREEMLRERLVARLAIFRFDVREEAVDGAFEALRKGGLAERKGGDLSLSPVAWDQREELINELSQEILSRGYPPPPADAAPKPPPSDEDVAALVEALRAMQSRHRRQALAILEGGVGVFAPLLPLLRKSCGPHFWKESAEESLREVLAALEGGGVVELRDGPPWEGVGMALRLTDEQRGGMRFALKKKKLM